MIPVEKIPTSALKIYIAALILEKLRYIQWKKLPCALTKSGGFSSDGPRKSALDGG